jgi:hypothetical protein
MTPKEKAIELFDKFEDKLISSHTIFLGEAKKQCALIAVDEILNLPFEFEAERKYWHDVKQEIEKL